MDFRPQHYYFTTFCEKTKQKIDYFCCVVLLDLWYIIFNTLKRRLTLWLSIKNQEIMKYVPAVM